jgi:tetratricopeptide (TPR) repeat protein
MATTTLRAYLDDLERLIEQEALEEVIGHCKYILTKFPKNLEVYRLYGQALAGKARYQEAQDIFERVLSAAPNDFSAHVTMSEIFTEQGVEGLPRAIWHMERAFEQEPNNSALQDELRRLIELRDGVMPDGVNMTRGALARLYYRGQLYDQAAAELYSALRDAPDRPDLQILLAQVLWENHREVESAEVCLKMLKTFPYALEPNRLMAMLWLQNGRPSDAAPFVERLGEVNPFAALELVRPNDRMAAEGITLQRLDWNARSSAALLSSAPDWIQGIGDAFDSPAGNPADDPFGIGGGKRTNTNFAAAGDVPVPKTDWFTTESSFSQAAQKISGGDTGGLPDWFTEPVAPAATPKSDLPDWFTDSGADDPFGSLTPQAPSMPAAPAMPPKREATGFTDALDQFNFNVTPTPVPVAPSANAMPTGFTDLLREMEGTNAAPPTSLTPLPPAADIPDWLSEAPASTPIPSWLDTDSGSIPTPDWNDLPDFSGQPAQDALNFADPELLAMGETTPTPGSDIDWAKSDLPQDDFDPFSVIAGQSWDDPVGMTPAESKDLLTWAQNTDSTDDLMPLDEVPAEPAMSLPDWLTPPSVANAPVISNVGADLSGLDALLSQSDSSDDSFTSGGLSLPTLEDQEIGDAEISDLSQFGNLSELGAGFDFGNGEASEEPERLGWGATLPPVEDLLITPPEAPTSFHDLSPDQQDDLLLTPGDMPSWIAETPSQIFPTPKFDDPNLLATEETSDAPLASDEDWLTSFESPSEPAAELTNGLTWGNGEEDLLVVTPEPGIPSDWLAQFDEPLVSPPSAEADQPVAEDWLVNFGEEALGDTVQDTVLGATSQPADPLDWMITDLGQPLADEDLLNIEGVDLTEMENLPDDGQSWLPEPLQTQPDSNPLDDLDILLGMQNGDKLTTDELLDWVGSEVIPSTGQSTETPSSPRPSTLEDLIGRPAASFDLDALAGLPIPADQPPERPSMIMRGLNLPEPDYSLPADDSALNLEGDDDWLLGYESSELQEERPATSNLVLPEAMILPPSDPAPAEPVIEDDWLTSFEPDAATASAYSDNWLDKLAGDDNRGGFQLTEAIIEPPPGFEPKPEEPAEKPAPSLANSASDWLASLGSSISPSAATEPEPEPEETMPEWMQGAELIQPNEPEEPAIPTGMTGLLAKLRTKGELTLPTGGQTGVLDPNTVLDWMGGIGGPPSEPNKFAAIDEAQASYMPPEPPPSSKSTWTPQPPPSVGGNDDWFDKLGIGTSEPATAPNNWSMNLFEEPKPEVPRAKTGMLGTASLNRMPPPAAPGSVPGTGSLVDTNPDWLMGVDTDPAQPTPDEPLTQQHDLSDLSSLFDERATDATPTLAPAEDAPDWLKEISPVSGSTDFTPTPLEDLFPVTPTSESPRKSSGTVDPYKSVASTEDVLNIDNLDIDRLLRGDSMDDRLIVDDPFADSDDDLVKAGDLVDNTSGWPNQAMPTAPQSSADRFRFERLPNWLRKRN